MESRFGIVEEKLTASPTKYSRQRHSVNRYHHTLSHHADADVHSLHKLFHTFDIGDSGTMVQQCKDNPPRPRDDPEELTVFDDDALSEDDFDDFSEARRRSACSDEEDGFKNVQVQTRGSSMSRATQTDYVLCLTPCSPERPPQIQRYARFPQQPKPQQRMRQRSLRNRPPRFQRLEEERHRQKASKLADSDEFKTVELTELIDKAEAKTEELEKATMEEDAVEKEEPIETPKPEEPGILDDYYIWSKGENVKWGRCTERLHWTGREWTTVEPLNYPVQQTVPPAMPLLHVQPTQHNSWQNLPISSAARAGTEPTDDIIPLDALETVLRGDVLSLIERQSILTKHHSAAIRLGRWGQATELRQLARLLFGNEWVANSLVKKTGSFDDDSALQISGF